MMRRSGSVLSFFESAFEMDVRASAWFVFGGDGIETKLRPGLLTQRVHIHYYYGIWH